MKDAYTATGGPCALHPGATCVAVASEGDAAEAVVRLAVQCSMFKICLHTFSVCLNPESLPRAPRTISSCLPTQVYVRIYWWQGRRVSPTAASTFTGGPVITARGTPQRLSRFYTSLGHSFCTITILRPQCLEVTFGCLTRGCQACPFAQTTNCYSGGDPRHTQRIYVGSR